MNLTDNLAPTVDTLIAAREPFAIFGLPGAPLRIIDAGGDSGALFSMCRWNEPMARSVRLGSEGVAPAVITRSTPREEHEDAVRAVVAAHTPESGKTVISRVICGKSQAGWGDAAADLFARFPDTFRYVCWSPATGGWLGATPEVLARVDGDRLYTMSLAGTKLSGSDDWDAKNRREQAMVTDFIAGVLARRCREVSVSEVHDLRYGSISHLCTDISARLCLGELEAIIDELNPTPAVAGYPRDEAVERIAALERHDRRFYAGYISVRNETTAGRVMFVNLRCANFDPISGDVCIYAGGGITALSDPSAEWDETARKAAPLVKAFAL